MTRKTSRDYAAQRKVRASGAPTPLPIDQRLLLSYEEVASKATLPIGTLRSLVRRGKGPRLIVVGKHHRFAPKDVAAWIEDLRDATEA